MVACLNVQINSVSFSKTLLPTNVRAYLVEAG